MGKTLRNILILIAFLASLHVEAQIVKVPDEKKQKQNILEEL